MPYDDTSTTMTNGVWETWNGNYLLTTTATTTTGTTVVWYSWVDNGTASTYTTTADVTWSQWVDVSAYGNAPTQVYAGPILSAEEIAAEQARIRDAADEAQRLRVEAVKKAKALLHSLLNEEQRKQLDTKRYFEFVSQKGKKLRMKHGYSRNIDVLNDEGQRVQTLCAHPGQYDLVEEDHMVAQYLTLKHDEDAFLRVANVS
jgi:hypothetical protein